MCECKPTPAAIFVCGLRRVEAMRHLGVAGVRAVAMMNANNACFIIHTTRKVVLVQAAKSTYITAVTPDVLTLLR